MLPNKTGTKKTPLQNKGFSHPPIFFCPISKEAHDHINHLFCYHLFIFMPLQTRTDLLLTYLQQQEKWRSESTDRLFSLYVTMLMNFHEAILKNDKKLFFHWEKLHHLVQQIHVEFKGILKLHHHDEILPSENIISFEAVQSFCKDIQAMQSKGLTFSPLGR
jgi:hypothetical protein